MKNKLIPKHQNATGPLLLNNSTPTLEEFISSKILEKKQLAIQKSYERTEPMVPYISAELDKENRDKYQKRAEYLKQEVNLLQPILSSYNSAELPYETHYPNGKDYDLLLRKLKYRLNELRFYEDRLKNQIAGASCLYTATDNYGTKYRCSGNQTFKANPKKFGFTRIPNNEIQPGDIVQDLTDYNVPIHGMIFTKYADDGSPLYNYSDGGFDEDAVKKDKRYPLSKSLTYTFTGLPSDSAQWKKEYEEMYKHKKGGRLIPKHQNSSKPLTEKNVRPIPSIVTKPRDKKKKIGMPKITGL